MTKKVISSGVVHKIPADLREVLTSDPEALAAWEDLTALDITFLVIGLFYQSFY